MVRLGGTKTRRQVKGGKRVPIEYEKKDKIAYITINGRNEVNPFSPEMYQELYHVFKDFRDDRKLSVAIITGEGSKAFSVGGDLKRMVKSADELDHLEIFERIWYPHTEPLGYPSLLHDVFNMQMWKPIVAAVNGYCLAAGLEILLLMTDIRVASEDAKFGFAEVLRGLAGGANTGVTMQIPHCIAMELLLTGEMMDAQDAWRSGLVNKVVPKDQVLPVAEEYARKLSNIPPQVLRVQKEMAAVTGDVPRSMVLQYARVLGAMQRVVPDAYEGQISFLERRDPDYKG